MPCRAERQSFGCLLRTMGAQLRDGDWSEVMEPLCAARLRRAERDARGRRMCRGSPDVGGPGVEIEVVQARPSTSLTRQPWQNNEVTATPKRIGAAAVTSVRASAALSARPSFV
jgi:hypothetical protein